jgi:hypothetical protein
MELLGSELAAGAAGFPSRVAMRSVPTIPSHATKPVSLHARSMIASLETRQAKLDRCGVLIVADV